MNIDGLQKSKTRCFKMGLSVCGEATMRPFGLDVEVVLKCSHVKIVEVLKNIQKRFSSNVFSDSFPHAAK